MIECKQAKEKWWNEKCEELEKTPSTTHTKLKELIKSKASCTSSGCIKAKNGDVLMTREKILERWSEYIEDLFQDERGDKPVIKKNMEGPDFTEEEVCTAIKTMKTGKAIGPDEIAIEMIKALDHFGIQKVTELANTIYNSGKIPSDLTKSIFIALPKKSGAIECELHRTISLMSHVTKTILHVLIRRLRKSISPQISRTQCGYVKDKGTRNATFMLRLLIEKAIDKHQDLYLCFIDYSKAFDKVQHENLMQMLKELNIDGKDLRLVRNLYWEQSAAVKIENELGEWKQIRRGVRQGCVMSPDLFNLYSENILRKLEDNIGVNINDMILHDLRYADDTVLIATSEEDLQKLLDIVVKESEKQGLSLNTKKTFSMVTTSKSTVPVCELKIKDCQIKQVDKFCYLGSYITSNGRSKHDIVSRISQGKQTFIKLDNILTSSKLTFRTRFRILKSHVWSVMLYGCESWSVLIDLEKRLKSAELWCLRRMLRIKWSDHIGNDEVWRRVSAHGIKSQILSLIIKRQMTFVGHLMRADGIEKSILTGECPGARTVGKPRYNLINNFNRWTKQNNVTVIETMHDRKKWRAMITDAVRHGT